MGYTTEFTGEFTLDAALTKEQTEYLNLFSGTRRMKRNAEAAEGLPDPVRLAVGLPIGKEAAFFVGGCGIAGQDRDDSVVDFNRPPACQPGLWCQWVTDETGQSIRWNGMEKFYNYVEWLEFIIANFIQPWGRTLNGQIQWRGEGPDDLGSLIVQNNAVSVKVDLRG